MACFPGASKGVIVWEWVNPRMPIVSVVTIGNSEDQAQMKSKLSVLDLSDVYRTDIVVETDRANAIYIYIFFFC